MKKTTCLIFWLLLAHITVAQDLMKAHLDLTPPSPQNPQNCLSSFSSTQDYFPEKVAPQYAKGFEISYHNSYKIIDLPHSQSSDAPTRYILVQCGAPLPSNTKDAQVIRVPIQSIIVTSTTHLPWLQMLQKEHTLKGLADAEYVHSASIQKKLQEGSIQEVIRGSSINLEQILLLNVDMVMGSGLSNQYDNAGKMKELGVPVVHNKEYLEPTPLARSEWIKFVAAFYNLEVVANHYYDHIAKAYQTIVQQTAMASPKPRVFSGVPYRGVWYMPGGQSYVAQYIYDAGGDYLWSDLKIRSSAFLDFEAVLSKAKEADLWIIPGTHDSLKSMTQEDYRYQQFTAWQKKQVFNNNARVNAQGGNDYWESAVALPHLLLADFVKVFHPHLLPEHQLIWFQQLQ